MCPSSGASSGCLGKGGACSTLGLLWLSTAQIPPERVVFLWQNIGPSLGTPGGNSLMLQGTASGNRTGRGWEGQGGGATESQWLFLNTQLQQGRHISPPPFCSPARAGAPQLPYLMPVECQDLGRWVEEEAAGRARCRPPLRPFCSLLWSCKLRGINMSCLPV